jgi:serine/threonine-protein kinase HipA
MITVDVRASGRRIGALSVEPTTQRWQFKYDAAWVGKDDRFALSPALPFIRNAEQTPEAHSNAVRTFFENLLPEGQALDDAAAASRLSKSNTFGLIAALGRETAGALDIVGAGAPSLQPSQRRLLSRSELSERVRARPQLPFTVWDGRVRLSIAGYQDKVAVLEDGNEWFLVDGTALASTHLLKPEPIAAALAGMTSNEHFCMTLARAVGMSVANVRLEHVPEPVLVVERFDRERVIEAGTVASVKRLHCIDGCQALGLPVNLKYERPFGSGADVRHIRDGASLPALFTLLDQHATTPARERIALLRWAIFQVLVGNIDAHAKNLTFFAGTEGLRLAPAYDLVSGLIYAGVDDSLAMAVGDEFGPRQLAAFDWATFAIRCGLPGRLVARELNRIANSAQENLESAVSAVLAQGGNAQAIEGVSGVMREQAERLRTAAPAVERIVREEGGARGR